MSKDSPHGDVDLEDFFENGALPMHVVDANGIVLRANKAELALVGYDAAEYIGRPIAAFSRRRGGAGRYHGAARP